MAENKQVQHTDSSDAVIAKAKGFWEKYSKPLMIISVLLIVVIGGWYGYQQFIVKPKEEKAVEAIFRAEEYFRMDSLNLALNGDGQNLGFEKSPTNSVVLKPVKWPVYMQVPVISG